MTLQLVSIDDGLTIPAYTARVARLDYTHEVNRLIAKSDAGQPDATDDEIAWFFERGWPENIAAYTIVEDRKCDPAPARLTALQRFWRWLRSDRLDRVMVRAGRVG